MILPRVSVMSLSFTLDAGRSCTLSAIEKIKACMRVHVGLLRKSWWSSGLNIRRVGCVYVCEERSGGGASAGVGGGGAEGGSRAIELRFRGTSLGSFALRSGGGEDIGGDVAVILYVCVVEGK